MPPFETQQHADGRRDLLVIVGLIGAGKSRLAKTMHVELAHWPLDFDARWHALQVARADLQAVPADLIGELIDDLNGPLADSDVVIDGWWTFSLRWFETDPLADDTLGWLAGGLEHHRLRLRYLRIAPAYALRCYLDKQETGMYDRMLELADPAWYEGTIPARMAWLDAAVKRWEER